MGPAVSMEKAVEMTFVVGARLGTRKTAPPVPAMIIGRVSVSWAVVFGGAGGRGGGIGATPFADDSEGVAGFSCSPGGLPLKKMSGQRMTIRFQDFRGERHGAF